jgi:hypothetical protein
MRQDERGKGQGLEDSKERDPGASEVATSRSVVVGPLAPGQRWTVTKKREVVLRIFRGESLDSLSRKPGAVHPGLQGGLQPTVAHRPAWLSFTGADQGAAEA